LTFAIVAATVSIYAQGKPCLSFDGLRAGTVVSAKQCTLAVTACPDVQLVSFSAEYAAADRRSLIPVKLGTRFTRPFSVIWDVSKVPNQLFKGMTVFAEASLYNGARIRTSRSGVFLIGAPAERPRCNLAYGTAWSGMPAPFIKLASSTAARAAISAYWNGQEYRLLIRVTDPLFHLHLPPGQLGQLGVELLFDPSNTPRPYPSASDVIVVVPVVGKPFLLSHEATFSPDGNDLFFVKKTRSLDCRWKVTSADFEHYTIDVSLPRSLFPEVKDSILCNVLVKTVGRDGNTERLCWIQGSGNDVYCSYLWGSLLLEPKPALNLWFLRWLIGFAGAFLLTIAIGLFIRRVLPAKSIMSLERPAQENESFGRIKLAIDDRIGDKNITIETIAAATSLSPQQITQITKSVTGKSFQQYLMFSRVELAKERLRSSHSGLGFIADSSGFKSSAEMERYFKLFCRTSPADFRREFHVT
jgi:AraC-like DNA-binding protein